MRLDVLLEGRPAGSLDLRDASQPVFRYDNSYLEQPHATPLSTITCLIHWRTCRLWRTTSSSSVAGLLDASRWRTERPEMFAARAGELVP